ncbi:serine protease FAM111A-like isoform X2 [Engystomops pustulosus]|uniref:serine protease FAM111A-like isoform X2 n=1 Tax=Engystomops pustulosus TaxID=76066 RepID=UPI003AFB772C
MADTISSAQELDKENCPDPLEQNRTKETSVMPRNPLQESRTCNLSTNTPEPTQKEVRQLGAKKPNEWFKKIQEQSKKMANIKEKSTPGRKKPETGPRGARSKSAGKGQSDLEKNLLHDQHNTSVVEETSKRGESTEYTKEDQQSNPRKKTSNKGKSADLKEKEGNTELVRMETKASISVSYKWKNQGENCGITELSTTIIDFAKQNVPKVNSPPSKKSGYLLVCGRELRAILNPWVPCGALDPKEILEFQLRRMKRQSDPSDEACADKIVAPEMYKYPTFHDGLFLKVKCQGKTKGGKEKKIIPMMQHYTDNNPMAVFGFLSETITQALHNDKRFTIPGPFSLEDSDGKKYNSDVLLSMLPDDTFTIVVHKSNQPKKRSPNETTARKDEASGPSPDHGPSHAQSEPPCADTPEQPVFASSRLSFRFSCDYKKIAKTIGQERLEAQLVNDYQKDVLYKDPMMASTHRLLTQHLDNVALLRYNIDNDRSETGTLFLLTETLALTCYHVVKLLIKSGAVSNVEVIFNYESNEKTVHGKYLGEEWSNENLDVAFVRIEISPTPPGLINYIAPPPEDGAVSIIGHPGGEHKKIDSHCSVIAFSQRAESIANTIFSDRSYIHVLTKYSFMCMNDPTLMTYDSCLYEGASGSPVFNSHGELVAMHTGGFLANTTLKKKSIIEYGRSTVDIIIHGAIHLEELRVRFRKLVNEKENLRRYLKPGGHPVKMQPVIRRLHKLWGNSDSQVEEIPGDSQVEEVPGDSQVEEVPGDSQVEEVPGDSQVEEVPGDSQVEEVPGDSQVEEVSGDSQVEEVPSDSQVEEVPSDSQVEEIPGDSQVEEVSGDRQVEEIPGDSQVEELTDSPMDTA